MLPTDPIISKKTNLMSIHTESVLGGMDTSKVRPIASRLLEQGIQLPSKDKITRNSAIAFDTAKMHFQKAASYGRFIELLKSQMADSSCSHYEIIHVGGDFKYECEAFSQAINQNLSKFDNDGNSSHILQIKDGTGKNIVEQFLNHLAKKVVQERDLGNLLYIEYLVAEKKPIDEVFNQLSDKTKAIIIKCLEKSICDSGQDIVNAVLQNPALLSQNFRKFSVLERAIEKLSHKFSRRFKFSGAYLSNFTPENICEKTLRDTQKIEQLQNFHFQLTSSLSGINKKAILKQFDKLDIDLKQALSWIVYIAHYKPTNVSLTFGEEKIKEDPFFLLMCKNGEGKDIVLQLIEHYQAVIVMREQCRNPDMDCSIFERIQKYDDEMTLPDDPVSCDSAELLRHPELLNVLPENLRIAMVVAELTGVVSTGGLAAAVEGMSLALGKDKTRIILPKYDVINSKIILVEKPKYQITLNGQTHKVFKGATEKGLKCYFIEDSVFNVGKDKNGKPNSIYSYNGDDGLTRATNERRRWAHFSSHAADLVYQLNKKKNNPVQLVNAHDAQTAMIAGILEERYSEEWKTGKTSVTCLTEHNVLIPLQYDFPAAQEILREIGLTRAPLTALLDGLKRSDMCWTVSNTYAKELQTATFGNGMHRDFKIQALKGKQIGIVNGNGNGWNPQNCPPLKKWKKVETGEMVDLTYGPDDSDLPGKIMHIRYELSKYMEQNDLGNIDPEKPIFFYVGRYDAAQKGIGKLKVIMEEAIKCGAQFICIGPDLDPVHEKESNDILKELEIFAKEYSHCGACVIRDYKRSDGRYFWQEGNTEKGDTEADKTGVQGFGVLLRAAVDIGFFPSSYEPCGLVQGEMHRMGVFSAATKTGGFADTIYTEGNKKNGYLFERCVDWNSEEQDEAIKMTVREAAKESQENVTNLYSKEYNKEHLGVHQKREIMRRAARLSWTDTPDGMIAPIDYYKLAYAKAFTNREKRGRDLTTDLHLQKL